MRLVMLNMFPILFNTHFFHISENTYRIFLTFVSQDITHYTAIKLNRDYVLVTTDSAKKSTAKLRIYTYRKIPFDFRKLHYPKHNSIKTPPFEASSAQLCVVLTVLLRLCICSQHVHVTSLENK